MRPIRALDSLWLFAICRIRFFQKLRKRKVYCVTPKYLSAICQSITSKPGSYWIEYYTVHEILLMLNNPNLTLSDIVDRMHFPAPPMLTRYLKRAIGQTPSEYRKGKI